jgi:hypothetical protein
MSFVAEYVQQIVHRARCSSVAGYLAPESVVDHLWSQIELVEKELILMQHRYAVGVGGGVGKSFRFSATSNSAPPHTAAARTWRSFSSFVIESTSCS